ncbi:MAG: hypothetical protein KatS3mg104_2887 [Phycisphaerae bacterium]|nr:MAG: hypothetical protein KatS3mg104_2887 [Phycisphaerae bacterium]
MILDWMYENFGLVEYLLCIELVVLVSAGVFYQIAKLIARQDRRDPLVKFYRVFWQAFASPVSSVRELDLLQIQAMARAQGIVLAGDLDAKQLNQLDAPDLSGLEPISDPPPSASSSSSPTNENGSRVRSIGRTSSEVAERLGLKKESESREARFAHQQKHKRVSGSGKPVSPTLETSDDDQPIRVVREPESERTSSTRSSSDTSPTVSGRCHVRIEPFQPCNQVRGYEQGEVVIQVVHAPEDGQANGVIIDLLSRRIGVRPYQIVLIGGHYKIRKVFQVSGLDQSTLDQRLQQSSS